MVTTVLLTQSEPSADSHALLGQRMAARRSKVSMHACMARDPSPSFLQVRLSFLVSQVFSTKGTVIIIIILLDSRILSHDELRKGF